MIRLSLAALAASLLAAAAPAASPAPAYVKAGTLPAADDRWDFASWDAEHQRLLVAHGKDVLVIDPASSAVRSLGPVSHAHGVLALPGSDRVAVTSGGDDSLRVFEAATGQEVARIAVGADPDAALLSGDGRTLYVMNAKDGSVSVVDLAAMKETGRIALKPALEVPVLASPTLLAVNDEDASEIELADLATMKAAGTIPLPGCEGPTGLARDPASGLALSACANGKAALVDLAARKVVALLPIGMGPDTALWDAARHRFLVPCGKSGTLSIIAMDGRKPTVLPAVTTEPAARTGALDPATGHLYLPTARMIPAAKPGEHATLAPGSFHVVVMHPA